jgi:hypothetical protein
MPEAMVHCPGNTAKAILQAFLRACGCMLRGVSIDRLTGLAQRAPEIPYGIIPTAKPVPIPTGSLDDSLISLIVMILVARKAPVEVTRCQQMSRHF